MISFTVLRLCYVHVGRLLVCSFVWGLLVVLFCLLGYLGCFELLCLWFKGMMCSGMHDDLGVDWFGLFSTLGFLYC